ncbi:type II toxin-antitoxin system RelE/ParE family toxin [Candidatus Woesearchaeota archaeon]|nr:type II toxin-antitoxin system RelE/ParE family toxin [Candidatus Woesearchaeota archaeon]
MVIVAYNDEFQKTFSKIKDALLKQKVLKQLSKLRDYPEVGKPMRFARQGTREIHISPYRLSYLFLKDQNKIIILDLYHKDEQ